MEGPGNLLHLKSKTEALWNPVLPENSRLPASNTRPAGGNKDTRARAAPGRLLGYRLNERLRREPPFGGSRAAAAATALATPPLGDPPEEGEDTRAVAKPKPQQGTTTVAAPGPPPPPPPQWLGFGGCGGYQQRGAPVQDWGRAQGHTHLWRLLCTRIARRPVPHCQYQAGWEGTRLQ